MQRTVSGPADESGATTVPAACAAGPDPDVQAAALDGGGPLPLEGFTVGITAARRREEFASLLQRRGAKVVSAPSIRIVPLEADGDLLAATRACLAGRLDLVVATTGIGFRGWLAAADGWGLGDALNAQLGAARIVARGPKARGAVRAAGLVDSWSPESESSREVLDHLLAGPLRGLRVAVQLHGEPQADFCAALREAGAEVLEVPVYRWVQAEDMSPVRRLVEQILNGEIDALAFTSAPAAASLLRFSEGDGTAEQLLTRLRSGVLVACVGPVCAQPLVSAGVEAVIPERARLGALVRTITEQLPARAQTVTLRGSPLEIRGQGVVRNGDLLPLAPGPMAVLRALAREPGRVLSRADLLHVLPGDTTDEHAVEMTVSRLRNALGDSGSVQTVVKRGYRLAAEAAGVG